jgi:signal transduction histidine kinase
MAARWWRIYLVGGLLAIGGWYLLDGLARDLVYAAVDASALVAILLAIRLWRPRPVSPWWVLAAGQAANVVGDVWYNLVNQHLLGEQIFPSGADGFYVGSYPLLAFGLLLLVRRRAAGADRDGLLDASMVTVGAAVLTWTYLMLPYASDPELPLLAKVVALAYPLGDLVLLVVTARLAVGPGRRPPAFWVLFTSLLLLLAADAGYSGLQLAGQFQPGSPVYVVWMLALLLRGAAALHPSMALLAEPAPRAVRTVSKGRLALLAGVTMVAPAVDVIQDLRGAPHPTMVVAGGTVVLFVLALARLRGLATEVGAHAERQRLLGRVLQAAEEERTRIASDLHDGPIQQLTALAIVAQRARRRLARDARVDADGLMEQVAEGVRTEVEALRRLMTELRPPVLDERGLAAALRDHVDAFARHTGLACQAQLDLPDRLDPEVETVLYRVVQESLTNVAKHARASTVSIHLAAGSEGVTLDVRDDGVGFEPTRASELLRAGHFGLASMRERVSLVGGRWEMEPASGGGTRIAVHLPTQVTPVG